jgi:xylitol oxidase
VTETNWAGNYRYRAGKLHRPSTVEQLQEVVANTPRVRALGSRHSFTDLADSDELVSLEGLPEEVAVDREAGTVSLSAALRYGELAEVLEREGLALANLASLPHISVAGAVATATHGSGDANGNLATSVAGLELVTSSGELRTASRGDPDFDGLVVGLGALGAVTRLTLDAEPAYQVRQRVFEGLAWDALHEHFDQVTATGDSVSVFTRWGEAVDQVWVKSRVTDDPEQLHDDLFGAAAATVDRHPIIELDPVNCTLQLGVAGPWWDRLPHFRMGFTPSSGAELQSEYQIPRLHAAAAIIHFTWHPDPVGVQRVLVQLEAALAPFGARPHWGKVFVADATTITPLYQRLPDFKRLVDQLDPRGAFRNPWLTNHVLGPP